MLTFMMSLRQSLLDSHSSKPDFACKCIFTAVCESRHYVMAARDLQQLQLSPACSILNAGRIYVYKDVFNVCTV